MRKDLQKLVETKETWKVIKNAINASFCNNLILNDMNKENNQISEKFSG